MLPRRRKRILCAETHEDTCRMLSLFLEREGHEVRTAQTVASCLQLAQEESFDLYMIDDGYPDGTNIELCQKLRQLHQRVPILFFSSASYERDRQRGLEAGAQAYLTKPGDIMKIAETIETLLRSGTDKDALPNGEGASSS